MARSTTAQSTAPRPTTARSSRAPDGPRPRTSPSSIDLVERAHDSLLAAVRASTPGERYVAAHLAALRGAAAVLAVRGRPSRRSGLRSVWQVLPPVAPELTEWAAFFDAGAARRAAVEAGRDEVVTSREADDLVREAETFLVLVESTLGLPRHHSGISGVLPLSS
ncbi:MAG TPA: SAV_6107 family HEPN domain-containing protein [Actinomycetales bacterium]|nr:SAV_6107 family HEPN domain-containing protein [Actinomycetales bacterium]